MTEVFILISAPLYDAAEQEDIVDGPISVHTTLAQAQVAAAEQFDGDPDFPGLLWEESLRDERQWRAKDTTTGTLFVVRGLPVR